MAFPLILYKCNLTWYVFFSLIFVVVVVTQYNHFGLPRWHASGKEPACQCRRHKSCGFNSLGQEDSLEEGMATHSGIIAWRIPWTEEPSGLQSIESQRVGHD